MSKLYEFVLIKDRNWPKEFDKTYAAVIVPTNYVVTTQDKNLQPYVRYLPPPYTAEDLQSIDGFVRIGSPAPQSWPSFKCEKKLSGCKYIYINYKCLYYLLHKHSNTLF